MLQEVSTNVQWSKPNDFGGGNLLLSTPAGRKPALTFKAHQSGGATECLLLAKIMQFASI